MLRIGEERSGSGNAAISSCTRAAITSREDTSIHHLLFCQSLLTLVHRFSSILAQAAVRKALSLSWFNPSQQLSTTQLLTHCPPTPGMGERIRKKTS